VPDIPTSAALGAAKAAARFRPPWTAIGRHNRLVREAYEDLLTFARDESQVEADALQAVRNELAARGMLRSGQLGVELRRARDEQARKWRDFKRERERRIEEIREEEGFLVKSWRKFRHNPWPENEDTNELSGLTRTWESEDLRRQAVELEVAPQQRAERAEDVWCFPDGVVADWDQAAVYRCQIGNRGQDGALTVTAQIVAETEEALADAVEVGDLAAGASTQREFTVACPHPRLYCRLTWRSGGEAFDCISNQIFPANPDL